MLDKMQSADRRDKLDWRAGDLLRALPVAVYSTDADGYITDFNEAAARLWGRRPEIGVDRWCGSSRLYWPDGSPMAHGECPMAVALRENRDIHAAEAISARPDGTRVPFLAFPAPQRDADGNITGAINTLVDLTEQKRTKDIEHRMAAIVESSHDAIVSKDLDGIIASWNEGAERLFGYAADEIIGKPVTILMPDDRKEEEEHILQRIRNHETIDHFETVRVRKDGRLLDISLTISPVKDESGNIVGASKIARDITGKKESERRIRELMREVNHRVKNQFAVILSVIRQTRGRTHDAVEFEKQIEARIHALSRSHDLLVQADWRGVKVRELINAQVEPFPHDHSVELSGPVAELRPLAVQNVGMAIHELCANSFARGIGGSVGIEWWIDRDAGRFTLIWRERGLEDKEPVRPSGFSETVLLEVTPIALGGKASLEIAAGEMRWSLTAPLDCIL